MGGEKTGESLTTFSLSSFITVYAEANILLIHTHAGMRHARKSPFKDERLPFFCFIPVCVFKLVLLHASPWSACCISTPVVFTGVVLAAASTATAKIFQRESPFRQHTTMECDPTVTADGNNCSLHLTCRASLVKRMYFLL